MEEQYILVFGKGAKERIIPIGKMAIQALSFYLRESRPLLGKTNAEVTDALFLNHSGTPLSDRSVRRILEKYVDLLSVHKRVTPHTLRHSFATLSLEQGMDIKTISHMLGHTDAGFTMNTYMHVTNNMQQTVADAIGNLITESENERKNKFIHFSA